MTPTLKFDLNIEPINFMWNGQPVTLNGKYQLVPDEQIRHLHKRVIATGRYERKRIPFYGRVVGKARYYNEHIYLVEDETGNIIKANNVREI